MNKHLEAEGLVEFSKKDFYDEINPRDICVTSRGYDHSRFETRSRVEVGRAYTLTDSEGHTIYDDNNRPVTKYFFSKWFANNKSAVPKVES